MSKVDEVVRKYTDEPLAVSGEEIQPAEVKARLKALEDNPDGSVTVHLLVDRISASAKTPVSTPYGKANEFWTNHGVRPSGDWDISFRLENREVAHSLAGVAKIGEEMIRLIVESHRLIVEIERHEETVGKVPGPDVEFDR